MKSYYDTSKCRRLTEFFDVFEQQEPQEEEEEQR